MTFTSGLLAPAQMRLMKGVPLQSGGSSPEEADDIEALLSQQLGAHHFYFFTSFAIKTEFNDTSSSSVL